MEGSTSLEGHHCGNQDPRGIHDYGSPFLHLGVQGRQTSLGTYGRSYCLPVGITLGRRSKNLYVRNDRKPQVKQDNLLQTESPNTESNSEDESCFKKLGTMIWSSRTPKTKGQNGAEW